MEGGFIEHSWKSVKRETLLSKMLTSLISHWTIYEKEQTFPPPKCSTDQCAKMMLCFCHENDGEKEE